MLSPSSKKWIRERIAHRMNQGGDTNAGVWWMEALYNQFRYDPHNDFMFQYALRRYRETNTTQ